MFTYIVYIYTLFQMYLKEEKSRGHRYKVCQKSNGTDFTSVANDKGDNEIILGDLHRSPGICLTAEEKHRKPQL